ncbi:DUF4236 domain-containing protein [Jeotgalibacillus aurantiacus]|uniref:DUF4236 domain-containing protein n=1 Tax=Jeotgalibacillus aurantiacus TaxID=2763266 RepID=UPI001D0B4E9F|nr:DUF4236 domain-containing protein [Jeotgalibacillus aurantiacus]
MVKFKKSFKVAPGVRINVGKKSVGISAGVKGARISTNSRSGTKVTAGIPGTGISKTSSLTRKSGATAQRTQSRAVANQNKQQMQQNNRQIVNEYDSQIDSLTKMHLNVSDPIDWEKRFASPPPFASEDQGPNYLAALKTIEEYKPTLRDKLFNRIDARKVSLSESLPEAKNQDREIYENWNSSIAQAEKILNGDQEGMTRLISSKNPFKTLMDIGADVDVTYPGSNTAFVEVALPDDYAPSHVISLTATGKLSNKQMAKGKYYQLQKEIVSSMMLKIVGELFNLFPLQKVHINIYANSYAVEPAEHGCIAAVSVDRNKFQSVYNATTPATDLILFFNHEMNHLKTKGFKLVQEVQV